MFFKSIPVCEIHRQKSSSLFKYNLVTSVSFCWYVYLSNNNRQSGFVFAKPLHDYRLSCLKFQVERVTYAIYYICREKLFNYFSSTHSLVDIKQLFKRSLCNCILLRACFFAYSNRSLYPLVLKKKNNNNRPGI